jgi:hypothetical protein
MGITRHLRSASDHAARVLGLGALTRWHVHSQETARRNAMVASTELAQRRFEREEVEEFLAHHRRRYDARAAHAAG